MVDYIADYLENIRDRRVFPDVKPGYMRELLNDTAPMEGEDWDAIFKDVERVIMPGVSYKTRIITIIRSVIKRTVYIFK
jgi:histidine decarboxylase